MAAVPFRSSPLSLLACGQARAILADNWSPRDPGDSERPDFASVERIEACPAVGAPRYRP